MTAAPPDGVLVVDKPEGPTSHDVVSVARRALRTPKVGHTGTLDPMATGVLVLVVGRATRLARYMASDVKVYDAQVTFGRATDTYDRLGETTAGTGQVPARDDLEIAVAALRGAQMQTPPAYSAKKIGGTAAYALARRDTPVVPAPVAVTIHDLRVTGYESGVATLTVSASAGFYVRSLAHDLGVQLGTGAHLSALRRTKAGAFALSDAVTWEALAAGGPAAALGVLPLDRMLPHLASAQLDQTATNRARHGQTVQAALTKDPGEAPVRLLDPDGHLIGIGQAQSGAAQGGPTVLQPVVILS